MKVTHKNKQGFTLIELLIVIAIIAILAAILMPVLSSAKARGDQIYCLNNMRQWALAFHMYCDDNNNFVPEEGNVKAAINSKGSPGATDNYDYAWYNIIPPDIGQPPLVNLYGLNGHPPTPPLPGTHSVFSCPSCASPVTVAPINFGNPLTVKQAFFMYGENGDLCVNWGTRYNNTTGAPTGIQQTKLINVLKPTQTIFLAEEDPNAPDPNGGGVVNPAQSNVNGFFVVGRHMKNTRCNLAMCDGSCINVRTNECYESYPMSASSPNGQMEWTQSGHNIYWFPSPTTPR